MDYQHPALASEIKAKYQDFHSQQQLRNQQHFPAKETVQKAKAAEPHHNESSSMSGMAPQLIASSTQVTEPIHGSETLSPRNQPTTCTKTT